jgi:hypothetical protein
MPVDLKAHLTMQLNQTLALYKKDVGACTEEQLGTPFNETTRTAYDFLYECEYVNRRMTQRITGEEPTPAPWTGWAVAPEEWRNRETAIAKFEASVNDLLAAALEDPEKEIILPDEVTTPFALALFADMHSMYHLGQIDYIQTLHGDTKMHWM